MHSGGGEVGKGYDKAPLPPPTNSPNKLVSKNALKTQISVPQNFTKKTWTPYRGFCKNMCYPLLPIQIFNRVHLRLKPLAQSTKTKSHQLLNCLIASQSFIWRIHYFILCGRSSARGKRDILAFCFYFVLFLFLFFLLLNVLSSCDRCGICFTIFLELTRMWRQFADIFSSLLKFIMIDIFHLIT